MEDIVARIFGTKVRRPNPKLIGTGKIIGIVVGIIVVIWLLTGIYTVNPGEVGVVRQFGKEVGQTRPGLHYHLPGPIQRVDKVNMEVVRTTEVGFRTVEAGKRFRLVPRESLMLAGDLNIVSVQTIVQYKVRDASQFLFKVKEVEDALHAATEVALRDAVGNHTIDYVMLPGRGEVQDEASEMLQTLMDNYNSGLLITTVKLQAVDPPEEVKDAFDEVVRAREDEETTVRQAEGYAADIVPRARGEKEKIIKGAEAYKQERIAKARGDAEKFIEVLEEYQKAPEVTGQRLYLETLERTLPDLEKIVIDSGTGGNLLQFLPLKGMRGLEKPEESGK